MAGEEPACEQGAYREDEQHHRRQHHVGSQPHSGSGHGLSHGCPQDRPQRPRGVEARHDGGAPTALDPQSVSVLRDIDNGVRPAHNQQADRQDEP